jgi:iron complex transport system substrate-binding protein
VSFFLSIARLIHVSQRIVELLLDLFAGCFLGKFYIQWHGWIIHLTKNEWKELKKTYIIAIVVIAIIVVASLGTALYYQGQNSNPTPSPSPTATPTSTPNLSPTASPSAFPVTLVDDYNNTVTITAYPQRVVSLAPANTQILFAVGAGNQVVGVTDYDKYPYNFSAWIEAGNMSSIGNYYQPPIEPIVSLNPDLIVASLGSSDAADQLRSLGYHVLTLNPTGLNGVMQNMLTVGKATGHDAEAQAAVNSMQQRIDVVVNGVKNATTIPKVYHEIWSDPYMSVGKGTFVDEVIKLAGGQNIFENATDAYPTVSSEAIITENPDIMVFPTQMGVASFWGNYTTVADRAGWGSISAVVNHKMFTVSGDIIDEPGPRQVDSLEMLAKIIHPEIFGNYTDTG